MTYTGNFRRGDEIRFRRGSNEYVGTVVNIHSVIGGLEVQADRIGGCRVAMRNVVRLETPKLTEKETLALRALRDTGADGHYEPGRAANGDSIRHASSVRQMREAGYDLHGTTFAGLTDRGLVEGVLAGINSGWTHTMWGLTEEGRRVARGL